MRFTQTSIAAAIALAALSAIATVRAEEKRKSASEPALDRIRGLAGDWKAAGGSRRSYRVIAGGSAVMETLLPGTPYEMITIYHLDGDDLVLTHYCAMGNQPRMKARRGGDPKRLVFEFAGGTNVDPTKDAHMHATAFTFTDADHVVSEWTSWAGSKKDTKVYELEREKK